MNHAQDHGLWRQRIEAGFGGLLEGLAIYDGDDRLVLCNARYAEYAGLRRELLVAGARFDEVVQASPGARRPAEGSSLLRLDDGRWLRVSESKTPDGGRTCLYVDVTELLRVQEELRLHSTALAEAANAVLIADRQGSILWVNRAFCRLTGFAADEVVGQTPRPLRPAAHEPAFQKALWDTVLAGRVWTGEMVEARKDGSFYVAQETITPLQDGAGQVTHFLVIQEDVSTRKEAESRIQYLAYHDPLTDLPNRALFQERLPEALSQARRNGTMVALHFLDLDRFKYVNDTFGHDSGDALLREVGRRLRGCLRGSDVVVRLGGDEFAILQTDLARVEGAGALARKVQTALAEPIQLANRAVTISASIGVAVFPLDNSDPGQLLRDADLAMYQAKREGRDAIRFYTPALNAEMRARLELERDLHHALGRGEFLLHYLPQIDLKTGAITGAEALLRWQHPERGVALPGSFIAVAEECGVIRPLTRWILLDACRRARAWQKSGLPAVRLSVNIAPASLQRGQLVELVEEALRDSELEPRYLELEVPETALLQELDVSRTIESLNRLGLVFAVDDFGTGSSSLQYLRSLRVNRLKIDRTFIRNQRSDRDSDMIARAIIDMAHRLELRVTAEGIETREQLARLRADGCDEGQGYCFSPSLPPDHFAEFLRAGRWHG